MKKSKWILLVVLSVSIVIVLLPKNSSFKQSQTWQHMVNPGQLSSPHAFLEDNCAACHTPGKGIEAENCIICHANNESLLQRQPTSFHATVGSCRNCHIEHQGRSRRPINMNHSALTQIGLRQLKSIGSDENTISQKQIAMWFNRSSGRSPYHSISAQEAILNCAICHGKEDFHSRQFGLDCAECHTTDKWTVPEFRHPSPRSTDCVQCHRGPPCHSTMHFREVCAQVSGKPNAKLNQCYQCHQSTAWNDIKGVGWYKSH